jgi:hypothetical protein
MKNIKHDAVELSSSCTPLKDEVRLPHGDARGALRILIGTGAAS